ncbi:hypothetical protein ACTSKR_07080 [Chitinibacteraceae bacterium HSL-7]
MHTIDLEIQSTLSSEPEARIKVPWQHAEIRADELIRQVVTEQCRILSEREQLNAEEARQRIARQYLSAADIARMTQSGRIALTDPQSPASNDVDVDTEADAALQAWRRRRFLLLVGDRQIQQADEVIQLHPAQAIRFVRLIPLQGG